MNLKKAVAALFLIPMALGLSQTARAELSFSINFFDPFPYYYGDAHWPATGHFYNYLNYPYQTYYTPAYYSYPVIPYFYSYSYYPYYGYYSNNWYNNYYPYYRHYAPYRYRYPNYDNRHHDYSNHDDHHDNHYGGHYDHHSDSADRYDNDRHGMQQGPAPRHTPDSSNYLYRNPESAKTDDGSLLQQKPARRNQPGNAANGNTAVYDTKIDHNKTDRNNEIAERLARKNSSTINNYREILSAKRPEQNLRDDLSAQSERRELSTSHKFQTERPQTRYRSDGFEQHSQRPDNSGSLREPGTQRSNRTEMRDENPRKLQNRPVESRPNHMASRQRSPERDNEISMNAPLREERAGFAGSRGFNREHAYSRRDQ